MNELNNAEIIDFIWWDVDFALKELNNQLVNKKYRFLFVQSNRPLFDISKFRYYLETTEIKNQARLQEIYNSCLKVVEIHNQEIFEIQNPESTDENVRDFYLKDRILKIAIPYDCIKINGKQISFVHENAQDVFFTKNFTRYASDNFARNCAQILNDLSAFIPDFFRQAIYIDIISRLYENKIYPKKTIDFDPFKFIDERENQAEEKGVAFYNKIIMEFENHKEKRTSINNHTLLYDDCFEYIDYCKNKIMQISGKVPDSIVNNTVLTLDNFFKDISSYHFILELLVKKGYCQAGTYIWKDEKNGNKSLLAAILKYLHKQGYLKNNKQLTNQQIQSIAQNTFGWHIGLDTIKKAKPEKFVLNFIPVASTLG